MALKLSGKLPTNAPGNGEFTHPLVHWNIVAQALEQAGVALSDGQIRRMASLGEEYDSAWETLQGNYGSDALKVEKILDELGLKKQFRDRLDAILEPRQREALTSPRLRDRVKLDLYSPMLIIAGVPAIEGDSRDALRSAVVKFFESAWKTELGAASSAALIDGYLDAVPLQPTSSWIVEAFTYDEAMAAGRAQAKLMRALLETEGLSEETKQRIRTSGQLMVPRLTEG